MQASVTDLAQHCAEETARFLARQVSDSRFCFELFRRALVARDDEAFQHLYAIYRRHVLGWIARNPRFRDTNEEEDYFVPWAFYNFYRALQGEKFARFDDLSKLLSYLRDCTNTTILQYLQQRRRRDNLLSLDQARAVGEPAEEWTSQLHADQLWHHIEQVLEDPRERQIAHAVLVLGYKPREVPTIFPDLVHSAREASLLLYRIRQRLRNDPLLRTWDENS